MNQSELDNFKKLIFDSEWVSSKSDTLAKNFVNDNNFEKYINACSDIIKKKKEPYYTLVKNNLKTVFFPTKVEIDQNYRNRMRERLQLILNKTYYNKNEVLEEVVWIVDEYITESDYAISKEILVWLNEQYKKD